MHKQITLRDFKFVTDVTGCHHTRECFFFLKWGALICMVQTVLSRLTCEGVNLKHANALALLSNTLTHLNERS